MLDVEFEWFDPQPEHDFHGIKTLLRQLFDVDAQLFDLSALADLVLAQPLLGSTVKVNGNETDPFAFLTVLNLYEHKVSVCLQAACPPQTDPVQEKPVIRQMTDYLRTRSSQRSGLSQLTELLKDPREARIGLILTERLINIPTEVVPPMYTMLLEEISWAIKDKEPYDFTHYLVLSKTYHEETSPLDEDPPRSKKQKKAGKREIFYFHPEDEALQQQASLFGSFDYVKESGGSDAKRTFQELGIKPGGHLILIEAAKFEPAVNALQDFVRQA